MVFLTFLIASGVGVAALVLSGWRRSVRGAVLAALAASSAGIISWLIVLPRVSRNMELASAAAMLVSAILLPGCVGGALARKSKSPWSLIGCVAVAFLVWLPFAYYGLFTVCLLDPRCDP